jgi:hypothetical protein
VTRGAVQLRRRATRQRSHSVIARGHVNAWHRPADWPHVLTAGWTEAVVRRAVEGRCCCQPGKIRISLPASGRGVQIADWNATGAEAACCSGATRPSAARVTVLRAGIAASGTLRRSASLEGITTLASSVICMELPANLGPYGGLCVYRSELCTIRVLFGLRKRQDCLLPRRGVVLKWSKPGCYRARLTGCLPRCSPNQTPAQAKFRRDEPDLLYPKPDLHLSAGYGCDPTEIHGTVMPVPSAAGAR